MVQGRRPHSRSLSTFCPIRTSRTENNIFIKREKEYTFCSCTVFSSLNSRQGNPSWLNKGTLHNCKGGVIIFVSLKVTTKKKKKKKSFYSQSSVKTAKGLWKANHHLSFPKTSRMVRIVWTISSIIRRILQTVPNIDWIEGKKKETISTYQTLQSTYSPWTTQSLGQKNVACLSARRVMDKKIPILWKNWLSKLLRGQSKWPDDVDSSRRWIDCSARGLTGSRSFFC